jgi:virginiamycin B lyase
MTLGRHGVVWFTRWGRRHLPPAIGHITPDGRVAERPVRHAGDPETILAAPDGDLWFTTEFPRRIARMTPHGKVKTWRRGAAAAGSIALGPEGNIWFAAADQDTVAAFHP